MAARLLSCMLAAAGLAALVTHPALAAPAFSTGLPPMLEGRYEPAAVPLPGGKVLIAGGDSKPGNPVKTVELYDPSLNSFEKLEGAGRELAVARSEPAFAALPGGAALIEGGFAGSEYPRSAEIFNPATNTFEPTTGNPLLPRDGAVAVLLKTGKVLVAGGFYESGKTSVYLQSAELYDPVTRTFEAVAGEMAAARYAPAAGLLPDGRVLIAGGYNVASSPKYLQSAEVFDPTTGTFEVLAAHMIAGRDEMGYAPLPNGEILIAGGYAGNGVPVGRATEVFNPQTMAFEPFGAELLSERDGPAVAGLPGERLLVVGGANGLPEYPRTTEVLSFPPTAATGAASGIGTTTATLNGTVVAEAASVAYFQYGTTTAYGSSTAPRTIGPAIGAVAQAGPVAGLTPGATYHFRTVAEGAGTISYGSDGMFTAVAAPAASHTRPPTVAGLAESHRTWREGSHLARISRARPPLGTTFSFALDQAARVTLAFTQRTRGRLVHRHCVAPTRTSSRRPGCTLVVTRATIILQGHAGSDAIAFEGVVAPHQRLRPGTYTLVLTATSAGGRSTPQRLTFTIVR